MQQWNSKTLDLIKKSAIILGVYIYYIYMEQKVSRRYKFFHHNLNYLYPHK